MQGQQYTGIFHILLVEDNPGDLRLLREAFRDAKVPHQLHVATDGQEALDFLHKRDHHADAPQPHLILLDLNLPKMSGHEVLENLKRDAVLHNIPVIVLSSSADGRDIGRAYELHANCYIQKPSDLASFVQIMRLIEDFWMRIVQLPGQDTLYAGRQERRPGLV